MAIYLPVWEWNTCIWKACRDTQVRSQRGANLVPGSHVKFLSQFISSKEALFTKIPGPSSNLLPPPSLALEGGIEPASYTCLRPTVYLHFICMLHKSNVLPHKKHVNYARKVEIACSGSGNRCPRYEDLPEIEWRGNTLRFHCLKWSDSRSLKKCNLNYLRQIAVIPLLWDATIPIHPNKKSRYGEFSKSSESLCSCVYFAMSMTKMNKDEEGS